MTEDELCVLRELRYCHDHPKYPEEWVRANNLSGPIGNAQVRALRSLLKAGLIDRKRGKYVNRYRCYKYQINDAGRGLLDELDRDRD